MSHNKSKQDSAWLIFLVFLKLGLSSFGGPIAHLGYFRNEFVTRKKWLSERHYADLVALCQFLPGPASSQVGFAIGHQRAGISGALAAWTGFTMPSAIILMLFAIGVSHDNILTNLHFVGVLGGLKIVAVAVVAQAVWGMAKSFCVDIKGQLILLVSTIILIAIPTVLTQVGVMIIAGFVGVIFNNKKALASRDETAIPLSINSSSYFYLLAFFILLIALPVLANITKEPSIDIISAFYRSGALVFGGGHVVLPLLQAETVATGWISKDVFLAGYGATQAVPGPLFTFSAFLGSSLDSSSSLAMNPTLSGLVCLLALFLPSLLLLLGVLPLWQNLKKNQTISSALAGINASVVGILLAALYQPIWTSAIIDWADLLLVLMALFALMKLKFAPWTVVLGCAVLGWFTQIAQGVL